MKIRYLIFTILMLSSPVFSQESNWEFAQDKEGIKVYTRQVEGSRFKEFRGVTEMEISLHSAVALLSDVNSMPEWVSDCKSTELLSRAGNKVVYYMEMKVPFPFDNRDMVQELTFNYDSKSGGMEVILGQNNKIKEPVPGIVRMPVSVGKWIFEPMGNNKYRVDFKYLTDPGGSLPAWLVNVFLVRLPFQTLLKFRDWVNYDPYNAAHFDWLEAPK